MIGIRTNSMLPVGLVFITLVLVGCVSTPKTMHFEMPEQTAEFTVVWPPEPEVARYAYIGDITGEQNLITKADEARSGFSKFLSLLVGLGGNRDVPQVLQRPQSGVTLDNGRIYVTDVSRSAVFVFDETAGTMEILTQAELGTHFKSPIGIAADAEGFIYVADSELKQIFVLGPDGQPQFSFGHQLLKRPTGLAWDPTSKRLYVADTLAHSIKIFDAKGELFDIIGGEGTAPGFFNAPTHLAFHNNELYVTDALNARIQVLTPDGEFLRKVGSRGMFVGQFTRPKGISVDSDGNLYTVESYYDHLIIFNAAGELLMTIGGAGQSAGKFFLPAGVWVDSKDRIFVADMLNGRIAVLQYLGNAP
ncbi:MAG: 6-bladed beta-propeller [Porticoccus sp.]